MPHALEERIEELVATHRAIDDAGLPYVLIGGWAVSAFRTRITMDIDVVIPERARDDYHAVLTDRGYTRERDDAISGVYEGRMIQYEKTVGGYSVAFDCLVDVLRCRQTDAAWSFDYLEDHSQRTSLAIAEDLSAVIPETALLFAIKLHSGRLADTRDLVILLSETTEEDVPGHLLDRGSEDALVERIEAVRSHLASDTFVDGLQGPLREKIDDPRDTIAELDAVLAAIRQEL